MAAFALRRVIGMVARPPRHVLAVHRRRADLAVLRDRRRHALRRNSRAVVRPLNHDLRADRRLDAGLLARHRDALLPRREALEPAIPGRRIRSAVPQPGAMGLPPDPALVLPLGAVHRLLRARPSLEHARRDPRGLRPHCQGEGPAAEARPVQARAAELLDPDRQPVRARLRRGAGRRRDPDRDRVRPARRRLVRGPVGRGPRPAADHGRDPLRCLLHRALQRPRRLRLRLPRSPDPADLSGGCFLLMAERLLEVKGLKVRFTTEDGIVRAVDGVDFELDRGKVLGIVGESGSGKSVTAMTILGLTREKNTSFEGEVIYKGRDLIGLPEASLRDVRGSEIAMIFQDPMTSLNPVYKVGDQIIEAILTHEDVNKATARQRAVELLGAVGIPHPAQRVDDYPHQFSGGMRQRAMIAMALSCNPDVLIADEPTTALDVTIRVDERRHLDRCWLSVDDKRRLRERTIAGEARVA